MIPENLPQLFLEAIDSQPRQRAFLFKTAGRWQAVSTAEMLRRVVVLSQALEELGVKEGDRVVVFAANRPEWHVLDFAALGLGATTVPIYFRESRHRLTYILNDSGAKVGAAFGGEQIASLAAVRSECAALEHIIAGAGDIPGAFLNYETLICGLRPAGETDYRRRAAAITGDQLASIIYTSGTTGEPKGVMLSHANLVANVAGAFSDYDFLPSDVALSFLPLSHVYERIMDYAYIWRGVALAYVEQMEQVPQALLEVRPTVGAAVPRFFEKIYAAIMERVARVTGLRRKVLDWSLEVARQSIPWKVYRRSVPWRLRCAWQIANRLAFVRMRQGLGGRIRLFISGGAPLARELAEFFWSIGVAIYEGYGLTETSPVVSANNPRACKVGTVGRPIRGVQVKIADDGEVLVGGASVMNGYYHKPEQTREAFTSDGWLRTGDIGALDAEGFLSITDRKKELLKTAAGKFVAPQPLENRLKTSPYITNAIVVGDRRKFIAALIVPNSAALQSTALAAGRALDPAQIASDPWVHQRIAGELERLLSDFAQYERPKRFLLLDKDFSFDQGELTYTLKLKRRIIEKRHEPEIEQLYADVQEPRPQPRT